LFILLPIFQTQQVFDLKGPLSNNILKFIIILNNFEYNLIFNWIYLKVERIIPSWVKNSWYWYRSLKDLVSILNVDARAYYVEFAVYYFFNLSSTYYNFNKLLIFNGFLIIFKLYCKILQYIISLTYLIIFNILKLKHILILIFFIAFLVENI
jgi:hypothetical protein